eukprot:92948-Rhodomonas_salina.3
MCQERARREVKTWMRSAVMLVRKAALRNAQLAAHTTDGQHRAPHSQSCDLSAEDPTRLCP